MFKKKETSNKAIDSLISQSLHIVGNVHGQGHLRIDGKIEGNIDYEGDLTIGQEAKIIGNIKANNIDLSGSVEGNIKARENLTLLPTAKLIGDVEVENFIIHEKAHFQGSCTMGQPIRSIENMAANE